MPVIVSLEVHASLGQQAKMVDIMRHVWAGLLLDESSCADVDCLPSPDQLRRKILVKVRPAATSSSSKGAEDVEAMSRPQVPQPPPSPQPRLERSYSRSSVKEVDGRFGVEKTATTTKSKILETLGRLGIYTKSYHFSHFDQPGSRRSKGRPPWSGLSYLTTLSDI